MVTSTEGIVSPRATPANVAGPKGGDGRKTTPKDDDVRADEQIVRIAHFLTQYQGKLWPKRTAETRDDSQNSDANETTAQETNKDAGDPNAEKGAKEGGGRHSKKRRRCSSGAAPVEFDDLGVIDENTIVTVADIWSALEFHADLEALHQFEGEAENLYQKVKDHNGVDHSEMSDDLAPRKKPRQTPPQREDRIVSDTADWEKLDFNDKDEGGDSKKDDVFSFPTREDFNEAIRQRRDAVKRKEQLRRHRMGRSKSDREVLLLLKAMQLRLTSALSHSMLLLPQKWATAQHDDKKVYPIRSYSPFLNLPDAGHFHAILNSELSHNWGYDGSIAIPQDLPPLPPPPLAADPKASAAQSTAGVREVPTATVHPNPDSRSSPLPDASSPNDNGEGRRKRVRPPNNPLEYSPSSSPPAFLAIAPNEYSSREFLRLCAMLSLLPDDRARLAVAASPLAAVSSSIQQQSSHGEAEKLDEQAEVQMVLTEPLPPQGRSERRHAGTLNSHNGSELSEKAVLGQADLVALWIRSQRSTSGFRHMINLFTIERRRSDESSLEGENIERVDAKDGLFFAARYVGNGRKTRTKVEKECQAMDELVQWSVLNQVLFTYRHVRNILSRPEKLWYEQERQKQRRDEKDLRCCSSSAPGRKPTTSNSSDEARAPSRDAQPNSVEVDGIDPVANPMDMGERETVDEPTVEPPPQLALGSLEAIHAQQAYLLRWFARRHRKALTILFLTEPMRDCEAVDGGSRAEWIDNFVRLKITTATKSQMKKSLNAGSDRTFARLDRRVLLGKYQTNENADVFHTIVAGLVDAFTSCLPEPYISHDDVTRLQDDLETMYKQLLPLVKHGSVSKMQLKPLFEAHEGDDEKTICSLLQSLPRPWRDHCTICNDEVRKGNEHAMLECSFCGKSLHQLCERDRDPDPFDGSKELSYHDIDQYPPLQKAFAARAPDSSPLPDFKDSSSVKWTSHRIHMRRNKKKGWGLEIAITELCQDSFSLIVEGSQLQTLDNLVCNYPMSLPHTGILVEGVKEDSPVVDSGVMRGDVIVAVSFVANPSPSEKTVLSEVEGPKRAALLKKEEKEAYIDVCRPSVDIVERSKQWLEATKRASEAVFAARTKKLPLRWYCRDCRRKAAMAENDEKQIMDEARRCRAVIRRLGMEWCSLPFQKESSWIGTDVSKPFGHRDVSLERLDRMMGSIIARRSTWKPSEKNPFLSGRSKGNKERLRWAPPSLETKPMELLCRGMSLIFTSTSECEIPDPFLEQRRELALRFLKLFTSWCLDCDSKGGMLGPPQGALRSLAPWEVLDDPEEHVTDGTSIDNSSDAMQTEVASEETGENSQSGTSICNVDDPAMQTEVVSNHHSKPCEGINPDRGRSEKPVAPDDGTDLPNDVVPLYNARSSLVGTSILLLPDDPIIEKVSRQTKVTIDHLGRPVEFVIVSYIPFESVSSEVPDVAYSIVGEARRTNDNGGHIWNGIYHAIPIMTAFQLHFVLRLCKVRGEGKPAAGQEDDFASWVSLEALNLPGVVRFSVGELGKRIRETDAMISSMERMVAAVATCQNENEVSEVLKAGKGTDNHCGSTIESWLLGSESIVPPELTPSMVQSSKLWKRLRDLKRRPSKERPHSFSEDTSCSHTRADCQRVTDLVAATECLVHACSMTEQEKPLLEELFDQEVIGRRQLSDPLFQGDPTTQKVDVVHSRQRCAKKHKKEHTKMSRSGASVDGGKSAHGIDDEPPLNVAPLPLPRAIRSTCTLSYSDLFVMDLLGGGRLRIKRLSELETLSGLEPLLELRCPRPFRHRNAEGTSKHCFVLSRMVAERDQANKAARRGVRSGGDSDEDWTPGSDAEDDGDMTEQLQSHQGQAKPIRTTKEGFRGRGWGLEFVRWSTEPHVLRVGRVHKDSPASSTGVKTHDVVTALNGKSAATLSAAEIAMVMLPDCRASISANTSDPVMTFLRKVLKKPSIGPVVVEVLRPRSPLAPVQINTSVSEQPIVVDITDPPSRPPTESIDVDIDPIPVRKPAPAIAVSRPLQNSLQSPATESSNYGRHGPKNNSTQMHHHPQATAMAYDRNTHQHTNATAHGHSQSHSQTPNNDGAGHSSQRFNQPMRQVTSRREINSEDLYMPGVPGTVFTLAESSVLFEARAKNAPLLGTRLLLPRYAISTIKEQYKVVVYHGVRDPSSIPSVSRFWTEILVADYRRSVEETGPISFKEGGFSYRTPTARLPLDRILENFLRKESSSKSSSQTRNNEMRRSAVQYNASAHSNSDLAHRNPHHGHDAAVEMRNSRAPSSYHHGGFSNAPAPSYHGVGGVMASRTQPHMSHGWVQAPSPMNHYEVASSTPPSHAPTSGTPTHHGSQVHHPSAKAVANVGYPSGSLHHGRSGSRQPSEGGSHPYRYHDDDTHRRSTQNANGTNSSSVYDPLLELPVIDLVDDEFSSRAGSHARREEGNPAHGAAVEALNFSAQDGDSSQDFEPPRIRGGGIGDDASENSNRELTLSPESEASRGRRTLHREASSLSRKRLSALAPSEWIGASVHGTCLSYKKDQGCERASFLGFVVDIPSTENNDQDAEPVVRIVHLSSQGILESPLQRQVDPLHVYVLEEGDYRRGIIRCARKLFDQHDAPTQDENNSLPQESGNVDGSANGANVVPAPRDGQKKGGKNCITEFDATVRLIRDICYDNNGYALLGHLPDGRRVLWTRCDPAALYLGNNTSTGTEAGKRMDFHQQVYYQYIRGHKLVGKDSIQSPSLNYCVWGCKKEAPTRDDRSSDSPFMCFDESEDLEKHLRSRHHYGCIEASTKTRLSRSEIIQQLSVDLCTSLCAQCGDLAELTVSVPERIPRRDGSTADVRIFDLHKVLDLTNAHTGSLEAQPFDGIKNAYLAKLLLLWIRIALLFRVEDCGQFRISGVKSQQLWVPGLNKQLQKDDHPLCCLLDTTPRLENLSGSDEDEGQLFELMSERFGEKQKPPCDGVRMSSDAVLQPVCSWSERMSGSSCRLCSAASAGKFGLVGRRPNLGCALMTETFLPSAPTDGLITVLQRCIDRLLQLQRRGILAALQVSLLRVAAKIPLVLRREGTTAQGNVYNDPESKDSRPVYSIWNEDCIEKWSDFICSCTNLAMVSQAYVVLSHSIHKARMPSWWKAVRGGWSDVTTCLVRPSVSSVSLRIHVLDAAVAEVALASHPSVSRQKPGTLPQAMDFEIEPLGTNNTPTKEKFMKDLYDMASEERIGKIVKWATEDLKTPKHTDETDKEECDVCGDGGDLICCEFCDALQHVACCQPPLGENGAVPEFDWVCNKCVTKLANRYYDDVVSKAT